MVIPDLHTIRLLTKFYTDQQAALTFNFRCLIEAESGQRIHFAGHTAEKASIFIAAAHIIQCRHSCSSFCLAFLHPIYPFEVRSTCPYFAEGWLLFHHSMSALEKEAHCQRKN